jgi:hypothetical protein
MIIRGYKHSRLMEESEQCVAEAAQSGTPDEMLIASRIFQHPTAYRRWESDHDRVMRGVSEQSRLQRQMVALRSAVFPLIHRRALFEFLRINHVVGAKRQKLFGIFYGYRDYASSVVTEHGNYLRCSSSYLCAQFLAAKLMRDTAFEEPLRLYEEWYQEYFRVFCSTALADTEEEKKEAERLQSLQPLLKRHILTARQELIELPAEPTRRWQQVEIRKPTGDTVKLHALNVADAAGRHSAKR